MGDNRTGAGEGDDEVIKVNLKQVPTDVSKITIVVTIHEAEQRQQNFGQVQNAFVRVVNPENQEEVVRYDLDRRLFGGNCFDSGRTLSQRRRMAS